MRNLESLGLIMKSKMRQAGIEHENSYVEIGGLALQGIRVTYGAYNIPLPCIIDKNGGMLSGQVISSWSGKLIS